MQKQTIKRFSVLGLVLIAASAVTAAIAQKSDDSQLKLQEQGSLVPSTNGDQTCTAGQGQCLRSTAGGQGAGETATSADEQANDTSATADPGNTTAE